MHNFNPLRPPRPAPGRSVRFIRADILGSVPGDCGSVPGAGGMYHNRSTGSSGDAGAIEHHASRNPYQ